jgi:hypothetical protein
VCHREIAVLVRCRKKAFAEQTADRHMHEMLVVEISDHKESGFGPGELLLLASRELYGVLNISTQRAGISIIRC